MNGLQGKGEYRGQVEFSEFRVKKVAPRDLSPPTGWGITASRKPGNFLEFN
jgi:hypothetical protein